MAFDLDTWKAQLAQRLPGWRARMSRAGVDSVYAALSAASLLPVALAYQNGEIAPALIALGNVVGGVGGNLLANQIQNWKDRSEERVARELAQAAAQDQELRAALDQVLQKLEVLPQAGSVLGAEERAWFERTLRAELQQFGSALQIVEGDYLESGAIQVNLRVDSISHVSGGQVNLAGRDMNIKQETHYTENVYIQPPPDEDAPRAQARQHYLERLRRACQALPLAAMGGEEGAGEEITLDSVYIALDTTTQIPRDDEDKKGRKSRQQAVPGMPDQESQPLPALDAFRRAPYLVLLGDPGAGKSTFVKNLLAWQSACTLDPAVSSPGCEAELLPVLVVLRELVPQLAALDLASLSAERQQEALAQAVWQHIQADLVVHNEGDFAAPLRQALEAGRCLLALDGLDEVPQEMRPRVRQAVAALSRSRNVRAPQRILVTCRVRSYVGAALLPGFEVHTLAPFDEQKIRDFVTAWYRAQHEQLGRLDADQAERRAQDLTEAALSPDLRELASNPLMLTSMAIIHQQEIGLPGERVRLYNLVVDVLLRRWQKRKTGERELVPSPGLAAFLKDDLRLRSALESLAYQAHRSGQKQEAADLERGQALTLLEQPQYLGSPALADEFLDYVDQRSGLLVGRGGELGRPSIYSFPHRTFQEYLAGCYLAGQRELLRAFYEHAKEGDYWDLAARLGIEELYYNRRGANLLLDLAYQLCPKRFPGGVHDQRALLWSGWVAALLGGEAVERDSGSPDGGPAYLKRLLPHLARLLASRQLSPLERAEAGRALARLGDPRPGIASVDAMQFAWVPPDPYCMGSQEGQDQEAFEDESPQHEIELPGYWIASCPVTNAHYDVFCQAGGYKTARYWPEASQVGAWRDGFVHRRVVELKEGRIEERVENADFPADFGAVYRLPNHPVVGVTWYEALAFCHWLAERWRECGWLPQGWTVCLPSEAEWEKAARGGLRIPNAPGLRSIGDGLPPAGLPLALRDNPLPARRYPWGDRFDPDKANVFESSIRTTSAVGCFPAGASPYGLLDMSGNVWEWTRSLWGKDWQKPDFKYSYVLGDQREALNAGRDILRVLRGGSFDVGRRGARCAHRRRNNPDIRYTHGGFRAGVVPLPLGSGGSGPLGL